jgi:hypothetical protein
VKGVQWFTTVDPLAEKYYSISPYVYVGNNPIIRTDPTGMDWYQDYKSRAAFWQEGDVSHIDRDGLRYYNIGSTYSQKVDDYTFLDYNQDTPTTYYFPDDFQNGDFARNAQISQSPYTQGGPDAMGWSFNMDGNLTASGGADIIQYVTFQKGPNYGETYAYQTSKIGGGSGVIGAGGGLSVTAYYYLDRDKSNFYSETLLGKGIEVTGSISARNIYLSGGWGVSYPDRNGIRTLSNTYGVGVSSSILPVEFSVRKTNTIGGVRVK